MRNHAKSVFAGIVTIALYVLTLSPDLAATTIVDFGGDYVSNPTFAPLNFGSTSTTGNTLTSLYSDTVPKSPSSGYTTPPGKSGTFYGAFETTTPSATPAFGLSRVTNASPNDTVLMNGGSGAGTNTLLGLYAFLSPDFLNGANTGSVSFDENSSLSLTILASAAGTIRMAALNDGQWYLSETVYSVATASTFTVDNPNEINWGAWTPPTSGTFPAVPSLFDVAGSTFTDIQGVGFYFARSRVTVGPAFSWNSFQATALVVPVPEPGVGSLLLAATAATLCVRRFRRN